MPDPSSERDDSQQSDGHSSDKGRSHEGHRRRRHRHKKEKPTSRVAMAVIAGLILISLAAGFFVIRPRLVQRLKAVSSAPRAKPSEYVAFGRQTVIIMNPTDKDWSYTTVTVNDDYQAHCPEVPKGTQFEIWFKNFRGPKGDFDPKAQKVQSVKIQPEGQEAIVWKPPLE